MRISVSIACGAVLIVRVWEMGLSVWGAGFVGSGFGRLGFGVLEMGCRRQGLDVRVWLWELWFGV